MMKRVDNIWVGWLDTSISFLAQYLPEVFVRFPYIVITSIDSSRDLSSLNTVQQILTNFPQCRFLDTGLMLKKDVFHGIMKSYNIFNGFDEMWFFHSLPSGKVPTEMWITGPRYIIDDVPNDLPSWMLDSGCVLGLGDGVGLNYVTVDRSLADKLEQKSNK